MPIYLYVKTHNKTGLKYLGKTISKDPIKYKGSGLYWRNHITKHGYDVTTEIIKECKDNDELKFWGQYYSDLWNIVESKDWANLKTECGDGGTGPNLGVHMRLPEHRLRFSGDNSHMRKPEYRLWMKENNPMRDPESRKKISEKLLGVPKSKQHKKNMFQPMSDPTMVEKISGSNNYRYDHRIYCFSLSIPGIEVYMTQRNFIETFSLNKGNVSLLVNGLKEKYKGWSIRKSLE